MREKITIPKAPEVDFEALQREAKRKAEQEPPTYEKKRQNERIELDTLTDKGAQYTIRYTKRSRITRRLKPVVQTFTIHEPTLAVLDEISAISLDFDLDNEALVKGGLDTIQAARRGVNKNAWRLAKIVAIATLGEASYDIIGYTHRRNSRRINNLARLLYATARPSQLAQLANIVTSQSNLGSFIHSIRLLSARTTQPRTELVESKG